MAITLSVTIDIDHPTPEREQEFAQLFADYLTNDEGAFIADYGPEAWGGYDGPTLRSVRVASAALIADASWYEESAVTQLDGREHSEQAEPASTSPLSDADRRTIAIALDKLWDEPVTDEGIREAVSSPYGYQVYQAWAAARHIVVVPASRLRASTYLGDLVGEDPIPSRPQVIEALAAADIALQTETEEVAR